MKAAWALLFGAGWVGCGGGEALSTPPPPDVAPTPPPLAAIWGDGQRAEDQVRGDLDAAIRSLSPAARARAEVYRAWLPVRGQRAAATDPRVQALEAATQAAERDGHACAAAQGRHYLAFAGVQGGAGPAEIQVHLDGAHQALTRCGEAPLRTRVLLAQAEVCRRREDDLCREDALEQARESLLPESPLRFDVIYGQAALLHDLGDVALAADAYADLLSTQDARLGPLDEAIVRQSLGLIHLDEGAYPQAREQFERATRLVERALTEEGSGRATSQLATSLAYQLWTATAGPSPDLERARAIAERLRGLPPESATRHQALIDQAMARLALSSGDLRRAQVLALKQLEPHQEVEARWRGQALLADIARARRDPLAELRALWGAVSELEGLRQRMSPDYYGLAWKSQRIGLYLRWIEALLSAYSPAAQTPEGGAGAWFVQPAVGGDTLLAALDYLAAEDFDRQRTADVGGALARLGLDLPVDPGRWRSGEELRRTLDPGEIHLFALPLPERLLLLRVEPEGVQVATAPLGQGEITRLIQELREHFAQERPDTPPALDALGAGILDPLLTPAPPPDSVLRLTLMGELQAIPVAALPLGGLPLVERYFPREEPSVGLAAGLPPPVLPPRPTSLGVVVGSPTEPLTFAQREVELLRLPGWKPEILRDAQARVATVRSAMRTANLIHFGVHGVAAARSPTGQRTSVTQLQLHDGTLDLATLRRRELRARLVVLAACSSGEGIPAALEQGYGSLFRSALAAGARAVISTRWPVSDEASALLMAEFYARWPGLSAAEALGRAMRALRAEGKRLTSRERRMPAARRTTRAPAEEVPITTTSPWAWAGFSVVGHDK